MGPDELTAKRAQHRQRLRDDSSRVTVALPLDGSVSAALAQLEELLLLVDLCAADASDPLPPPLAEREAADAVGRLASYVAGFDRAVEENHSVVQPVAPDGKYELVPLCFAPLGREDRARFLGAVEELKRTRGRGSHPAVDEALSEFARDPQVADHLIATAERAAALLELVWDDDVDLLAARLNQGMAARHPERVVLSAEEYAAYGRVTQRILASWHADDPLERFLYRGT